MVFDDGILRVYVGDLGVVPVDAAESHCWQAVPAAWSVVAVHSTFVSPAWPPTGP